MSPEHYLIDLLTDMEPVSMREVRQAFGDDEERARRFLLVYANRNAIAFSHGDAQLPEWRAKELLREPAPFEGHGDVTITLTPHGVGLLEKGIL